MFGLTRGTSKEHFIRATLESMAYQTKDILGAMERDSGYAVHSMQVDGGAVSNSFLMKFQSDILGVPVERPVVRETTALGAAYLAGLAVGYWSGLDEIKHCKQLDRRFEPSMSAETREALYNGWIKAVHAAMAFK
ncbi:Glycerol kinase [compost metagenome]